jgi:iron complex transport system permease protein
LLRNPLAEPYILGISSGAAVGAMISLLFGLSALGTPLAAFLGATLTILVVYRMGLRKGQLETHTLILAGVVVGAFFSALIMCLVVLSIDPYQNITFWLMGNLSNAHPEIIKKIFPVSLLSVSIAFLLSRRLNILVMGEEHALQLGLPVENFKRLIFVLGSLLTAISVSYTGIIGFVGLIIPHIIRLIWGPDHRLLIPASVFLGASFLVLADLLARTVFAPLEIPVGIVTAFLGAPFFLYLLKKQKNYFV